MNEREMSMVLTIGEEFASVIGELQDNFTRSLDEHRRAVEATLKGLTDEVEELKCKQEPDIAAMVADAVKSMPLQEMILKTVQDEVRKAVADIPVPQDGKSVTVEELRPVVETLVNDAVSAVPPARDGRDYDPEVLKQAVQDEVSKAVAEIPVPQDGKSVTVDDVRPVLETLVNDAVSAVPPARDGRDYDPEVLKQAVQDEVRKAVAEIPVPQDGRDATALEILPCIDTEKSYPRGSWATQDGGLWRAYEKTHGMRGWECVVDGISGVEVLQEEPRSFSITLTRSGGARETTSFPVPVMLYRGVFSAGTEYQPGDTVTWGGSLWHCDTPTCDKPGEPHSQGWTLAVKRGRDAGGGK